MTPEKFKSRLKMAGDCLEWQGAVDTSGYGHFRHNGKIERAHRWAFLNAYGAIPKGKHILHSCDNRKCCNPDHLRAGSHAENMADMRDRGRRKNICVGSDNGRAMLTADDVVSIRCDHRGKIRLSRQYGVSPAQIQRIRAGKQWGHV